MTSLFQRAQRAFSNQMLNLHVVSKCSKNENTYLMLSFLIKKFHPQILDILQFNASPTPLLLPKHHSLHVFNVVFDIFRIHAFTPSKIIIVLLIIDVLICLATVDQKYIYIGCLI